MGISFAKLYDKLIHEQGADPNLGAAPTPGGDPMGGNPAGAAPPPGMPPTAPGADPMGGMGDQQQQPPPQKYTLATEKGAWQILKDYAKNSEEKVNKQPEHNWGKPKSPQDAEKKEFKPNSLRV